MIPHIIVLFSFGTFDHSVWYFSLLKLLLRV